MSNTTVEYKRRNSNGFKNTRVRADTWVAHVNDFAPDDRSDGFATVDIHTDMLHSDRRRSRPGTSTTTVRSLPSTSAAMWV